MISFALFSVTLFFPDGRSAGISAEDLSADGFTFRLTPEDAATLAACPPSRIRCVFRGLGHPLQAEPASFSLLREEDGGDATRWRVFSDDPDLLAFMRAVTRDILTYEELKNTMSDADVTARYTHGPVPDDTGFPTDFHSWRSSLFKALRPDPDWADRVAEIPLFLSLSFPETVHAFLSLPFPEFKSRFFRKAGLSAHPVSLPAPTGLVFGNGFCPGLFPRREILFPLLRRGADLSMKILLNFPPVPEEQFDHFIGILSDLAVLPEGERPELILNDWGLAGCLRQNFPDRFSLTAGPLLCRRVKDPRSRWRFPEETPTSFSPGDGPEFRHLLSSLGFHGTVLEADRRLPLPSPGDSVLFPFFQLSTATRCTLHAVCRHGSRGMQPEQDPCEEECDRVCFAYDPSLGIIGRGNSLFAADTRLLTDASALSALRGSRLLLDLL